MEVGGGEGEVVRPFHAKRLHFLAKALPHVRIFVAWPRIIFGMAGVPFAYGTLK